MPTYYYAKEMLDGTRKFDKVHAVDFDAAFDIIHGEDGEILSISTTMNNVEEDVYCIDNDC